MERFLTLVARDLLDRYGTNLTDIEIVFPNKRAGLFMNQALVSLSATPVWAPRYQTISELFRSLSDYELCDPIRAVCELYRVYADHVGEPETADRFYSWGEILLADFDDIDKHLADARALFSNIQALKSLDSSDFLTPEQESALRRFFDGFSVEGNSRLKEKFLRMWNVMDDIYTDYGRRLRDRGVLYEGALYRHVATERLTPDRPLLTDGKTYIFVGFNVLNDVERRLFDVLRDHGKALFYWDYDRYYTEDNPLAEAGTFIRDNLRRYPCCLPAEAYDNLRRDKEITYIAAPSENAQARFLPQWLRHNLTNRENETAVVLCDETLLRPVLHSISPHEDGGPGRLNITMGYPLTDTPVYSFINALLDLQTEGYDDAEGRFRTEQRERVDTHPYAAFADRDLLYARPADNTALLDYLLVVVTGVAAHFRTQSTDGQPLQPLYNETLFQTHNILNRFRRLTEDGTLDVRPVTLRRLIRAAMETTSVPFHGEPATGLQVMGVLETRNLDFRHVVLLSVNEGKLPRPISNTSFIPYSLREVFGLTTVRHKTAVYAFYFYRLLQRAECITMLYNVSTDGSGQGEMSRFMQQLLAETDLPVRALTLDSTPGLTDTPDLRAEKTDSVMRILQNSFDERCPASRPLSPSALNDYADCPLKFYYRHVARLRVRRDPADGLDAALFGTVFHAAAEGVYRRLTSDGPLVTRTVLERLLAQPDLTLRPFVDEAFRQHFFCADGDDRPLRYDGTLVVARRVILSYLRQLLTHDLRLTPFEMKEMEQPHEITVSVPTPRGDLRIRLGGIVDRMDIVRVPDSADGHLVDTVRILDYKTGGRPEEPRDMAQLTAPDDNRPHYSFQTFLYAWVVCHETTLPVMPALFFVHKSHGDDYSPLIPLARVPVTDFRPLMADFEPVLRSLLEELFDPARPFTQTDLPKTCARCDFRSLCGRD